MIKVVNICLYKEYKLFKPYCSTCCGRRGNGVSAWYIFKIPISKSEHFIVLWQFFFSKRFCISKTRILRVIKKPFYFILPLKIQVWAKFPIIIRKMNVTKCLLFFFDQKCIYKHVVKNLNLF